MGSKLPYTPRIMTVGQGCVLSGSASGNRRGTSPNLAGLLGETTMYFLVTDTHVALANTGFLSFHRSPTDGPPPL